MKRKGKSEEELASQIENGTMAPDLEDMKNLGKQMENMRTNKELAKYDKQPDPIQHEQEQP